MEEQTPLSETQRIRNELDAFEREKLTMQVLLYSSCHLVVVLREDSRVTTDILKDVRALAMEKAQLLSFVPTSTKHSKREPWAATQGSVVVKCGWECFCSRSLRSAGIIRRTGPRRDIARLT